MVGQPVTPMITERSQIYGLCRSGTRGQEYQLWRLKPVRPITHLESADSEFEFPSEAAPQQNHLRKFGREDFHITDTENSLAFNLTATFHRYSFLFRRIFP
jgi:hypothetical protein